MDTNIKIGIVGYGNLGKGVEKAIGLCSDLSLEAIFTRRKPDQVAGTGKMAHVSDAKNYIGNIDVMILCGGSATDLPEQGPEFASMFTTVDSFDNHGKIPEYFETMNDTATRAQTLSVISTGWDPGLFSLHRLMTEAVLPAGNTYTFWGKGVSQGHSDAVRRVAGVKNGVQYTIPNETAVTKVRAGELPELATRDKHIRECFVVAESGADKATIEREIKTMPGYFADYDTIVHFISEEELLANHAAMPHGGLVIRSGRTGQGNAQVVEFGLTLGSNPEFTASVLVAYARAAYKLRKEGQTGARTVFDIPYGYLSPKTPEQLRKELL